MKLQQDFNDVIIIISILFTGREKFQHRAGLMTSSNVTDETLKRSKSLMTSQTRNFVRQLSIDQPPLRPPRRRNSTSRPQINRDVESLSSSVVMTTVFDDQKNLHSTIEQNTSSC